MYLHLHAIQRARDRDRVIVTGVVHDDDVIDNPVRHHLFISLPNVRATL
jgi:hypothetical protein